MDDKIKKRFFEKVNIRRKNECWEWQASLKPAGYGQLTIRENGKSKLYYAHRLSWIIHNGDIPDELQVLHKCDNRKCVNPNHLFLGTQYDNIHDMHDKNRNGYTGSPGEKHPMSKLTKEEVKAIREMYRSGKYTKTKIAKTFNIDITHAGRIIDGKSWKHIKK